MFLLIIKYLAIVANYILLGMAIIIFSLVNIRFTALLLPAFRAILLIKEKTYPNLALEDGLSNFLIVLLGLSIFGIMVLLFIALGADCLLRRKLENNKFGTREIVEKNRILRFNQKAKAIHVWSMSLLIGVGLFSITYQLGPNEYTPPPMHSSGESYSSLGMAALNEADINRASIRIASSLGGVLNR